MWSSVSRTISNSVRRLSVDVGGDGGAPRRSLSDRRPTIDLTDVEKQDRVVHSKPSGIYEKFRLGLLKYHSEVGMPDEAVAMMGS